MKTVSKIILALCILFPTISNAQKSGFDKEFSFNKNSKTESFTFNVEKGTKKLIIDLEGIISTGSLKVKIKDPDKNDVSGFTLVSSKSLTISYSDSDNDSRNSSSSRSEVSTSPRAKSSASARSSSRSSSSVSSSSSSRSSSVSVSVEVDDSNVVDTKNRNTHIYTNEKTETNDAGARGVINKEIKNPTEGVWKFTIYPDDTEGYLSAKISCK